jgi:hypothetical protein
VSARDGCEATLVAANRAGHIAACSCGHVHVHLRSGISLHLEPDLFAEIVALGNRAVLALSAESEHRVPLQH